MHLSNVEICISIYHDLMFSLSFPVLPLFDIVSLKVSSVHGTMVAFVFTVYNNDDAP